MIDDRFVGADGVRLGDINRDGLSDVVVPWEEEGLINVYLHPGYDRSRESWPAVTVGEVGKPEDAVFVDLDGSGMLDVVSCSEKGVETVWVHWAPDNFQDLLNPDSWQTSAFPALRHRAKWMFALPFDFDHKNGTDLIIGSRGKGSEIGWLQSPLDPRDLDAWTWHPLGEIRWIMSILETRLPDAGHNEVLVSNRRPPNKGIFRLNPYGLGRNESYESGLSWIHEFGDEGEVMFINTGDIDGDGEREILAAVRPRKLVLLDWANDHWNLQCIPFPPESGTAKGVAAGDLDDDGHVDIALTCERAKDAIGVFWMRSTGNADGTDWEPYHISGKAGVKFDLIQLVDIDGDKDLDLLTCEENSGLGVIWYENPF